MTRSRKAKSSGTDKREISKGSLSRPGSGVPGAGAARGVENFSLLINVFFLFSAEITANCADFYTFLRLFASEIHRYMVRVEHFARLAAAAMYNLPAKTCSAALKHSAFLATDASLASFLSAEITPRLGPSHDNVIKSFLYFEKIPGKTV